MTFSIGFDGDAAGRTRPGRRAAGRIVLADEPESFSASLAGWSTADYERHWLETARSSTEAEALVFCTDLPRSGLASLWLLLRAGEDFDAYNLMTKTADLVVNGRAIQLTDANLKSIRSNLKGVSSWRVSGKDVREFADGA